MSEYSRVPPYRSNPALTRLGAGGSVRSYDPRVMELCSEPEEDDFGFKSLPEFTLSRIFSIPDGHDEDGLQHAGLALGASLSVPKKKRRAPDPPSNLVRNKYPSSDDIIALEKDYKEKRKIYGRPTSLSPNRRSTDLWNELLDRMNTKSPTQQRHGSPRHHRSRSILNKLRSPRINRKPDKRAVTEKEEEEAGFVLSSSNQSSFDDVDGGQVGECSVLFGLLQPQEMERDVEFEVIHYDPIPPFPDEYVLYIFANRADPD